MSFMYNDPATGQQKNWTGDWDSFEKMITSQPQAPVIAPTPAGGGAGDPQEVLPPKTAADILEDLRQGKILPGQAVQNLVSLGMSSESALSAVNRMMGVVTGSSNTGAQNVAPSGQSGIPRSEVKNVAPLGGRGLTAGEMDPGGFTVQPRYSQEELMRRIVEMNEDEPFKNQFNELFDASRLPSGERLSSSAYDFLRQPAASAMRLGPFLRPSMTPESFLSGSGGTLADILGQGGFGSGFQNVPGYKQIFGAARQAGGDASGFNELQSAFARPLRDPEGNRDAFEMISQPFLQNVPKMFRGIFANYLSQLMNEYQAKNKGTPFLQEMGQDRGGAFPEISKMRNFLGY